MSNRTRDFFHDPTAPAAPESSKRPVARRIPAGIDYPEPVASAVAAYGAAHQAWREEYARLARAEAAVPAAALVDAAALSGAVRAGRATPKPTEPAARDELARQTVRTAQSREAAAAATAAVEVALVELADGIIGPVLDTLGAALDAYDDAIAQAVELERAAYEGLRLAAAASVLLDEPSRARGVRRPHLEPTSVGRPRWAESGASGLRTDLTTWARELGTEQHPTTTAANTATA